jgi:uncharacterized protein (DUF433 family)
LVLPIILVPHPHVTVSETVLGGSPFVSGSRVPVRRLYAFYENGATIEQLLKRFPHLSPAKVLDALAFALDNPEVMEADMAREAEMLHRVTRRSPARAPGAEQMALPFEGSASGQRPRRAR